MQQKSEQKQQSFLYATLVLGVSTILVKIMGAIFRIPLSNLIGATGMGYFSTAYDVYLPIYSLAMAGLPVAVSRIVAQYVAEKRYNDARKALKVVKRVFLITGLVGFALMFAFAFIVTALANNPNALPAMFVIAPSILFCCVMSSYRGYYEGLRNMFPTAISSLIEAICKLGLGYSFAYIAMITIKDTPEKIASYAAAAAMLGITIGTALGSLFLVIRHKTKGDGFEAAQLENSPPPETGKNILIALVSIAVPVALGSLVNNVASLVDVAMVQRQLGHAVQKSPDTFWNLYGKYFVDDSGNTLNNSGIPNFLYGCYKGYAYTIFNFIPTITAVVGVSALPVLTMAWTSGEKPAIKSNIESMLKVITLIAYPAGIGVMALAPQIVSLLYKSSDSVIAGRLLVILGLAACFAGMTTPLTNMLQAIGKPGIPVKNIAVGAVIKIVVNFCLVGVPEINILGAPIGTVCCYLYIAVADIYCLVKYSGVKPNLVSTLLKPFIAAATCGITAFVVNYVVSRFVPGSKISTLVAILAAVVVYIIAVSMLKCIDEEDINTLPNGKKIVKFLKKVYIIR